MSGPQIDRKRLKKRLARNRYKKKMNFSRGMDTGATLGDRVASKITAGRIRRAKRRQMAREVDK